VRDVVMQTAGQVMLGLDRPAATAEFSPDWDPQDPAAATYRYTLTRTWDAEIPPVVFAMLNPSKATAEVLDPTVAKCVRWAQRWGAGGLIVVNMFGLRSTDPAALLTHPDPVGPGNDEAILDAVSRPILVCVVAWGAHAAVKANDRARERRVAELIRYGGQRPMCLAVTRDGHPGHPLYLKNESRLTPWEML
jgi:hypothetical protein